MRNLAKLFGAVLIVQCLMAPVRAQSVSPKAKISPKTPSPTVLVPSTPPAAGVNLVVSPAFMNLITDPGVPVSTTIRVTNQNNFREYLQINLMKFTAASNGETPELAELTPADEFAHWISFSDPQFMLESNQTKTIKVTISPPPTAELGYYYALVVSRMKDNLDKAGSGAGVVGSPAISVLLEVRSAHAQRELELIDFRTDSPWYEYLPAEFRVRVKNTGNVHIVPSGDIFVDWGTTKDVAILHANEARGNVMPQTERTYTATWNDGFIYREPRKAGNRLVKDKDGHQVYDTKFDLSRADKFRIGRYTAHLLMVYDNGKRDVPVEATLSFWIIPWKLILVALVIIYFVLAGIKNTIMAQVSKAKKALRQ